MIVIKKNKVWIPIDIEGFTKITHINTQKEQSLFCKNYNTVKSAVLLMTLHLFSTCASKQTCSLTHDMRCGPEYF